MTFCIVVARYEEDIEWTKQFPNLIIYNKGSPLDDNFNEIKLNNVGREGHTYYKHIYDNYDNLSDYTIFLQGKPFDHYPNIITYLNNNIINNKNLSIDFELLTSKIIECDLNGCRFHGGLPLYDTYCELFGVTKNFKFVFGQGGQFIVSKEKILQRPREFYLKIVKMLEKELNPVEGYVIERFTKLIFT